MQGLTTFPRLRAVLGIIAVFFGIGFLIYGWSLHNPFVRWDDGMLIYENPAIRQITPATLRWIFTHFDPELYIPLTFFSYQIDYLISGIHPFLYHFDNLVLHILNALLVAFVAFTLLKRRWVALFCGLLFLVHPLNTEGIEWASGRKDVLSTFFLLASIASYILYRSPTVAPPGAMAGRRRWYIISLVLFLCGLLSKVMIITLPVVLVLLDDVQHRKVNRAFWIDKIPYFLLSVVFGLVGILGKASIIASTTITEKGLMAFKSSAFYVQQFVWPFHFSLLYPYTGPITATLPDFYVPMIIVAALLLCAALLRKHHRLMTFGILFYFVTVGPTLLNFAKGELDIYFGSDRYAYVPQIGLLLVLGSLLILIADFLEQSFDRKTVRVFGSTLGVLLLSGVSALAYRQSLVWSNTQTLFQHVIVEYPDASYVAYNNLCNAERLNNNLPVAEEDCTKSIQLRPHAKTYSNLGAVYRKEQKYDAAVDVYQKGIALDPTSPYPHFGLGIVYATQGRFDLAEKEYLDAIKLKPNYADVFVDLGAVYAAEGKYPEAIAQYQKALDSNPFQGTALFNMAVAEAEIGKTDDAMRDYRRAISADGSQIGAHINLGLLLYNNGKTDEAIDQFRAVLRTDPENQTAHSALKQLGAE